MPPLKIKPTSAETDQRLADLIEFEIGFRRNGRNNLCREFRGNTVTVFKRPDGRYSWSVLYSDDYCQFAQGNFKTEDEAMSSLIFELFEPQSLCPLYR